MVSHLGQLDLDTTNDMVQSVNSPLSPRVPTRPRMREYLARQLNLDTTGDAVELPNSPLSPRLLPVPRMREYLAERLYASKIRNSCFWCEEDLRYLWSNEEHAQAILNFENGEDLKRAQTGFFKILSVLVHINCFHQGIFKNRFYDRGYSDAELPFNQDLLFTALGSTDGQLFHDSQFMSIPLHIDDQELANVQDVQAGIRWPFEYPPEKIGSGGYGDVYRAYVPRGYIRTIRRSGQSSNDNAQWIAFKRMGRAQDGGLEFKNTNFLKEGLAKHSTISVHLAAIVQEPHFYIFLDYAELGNLESFLNEGDTPKYPGSNELDERLSYNFAENFPEYCTLALFDQMKNLIGALKVLHGELQIEGSPGMYCRHMDLKPDNILIFPGGRVGTWKLSDFGISAFKSRVKAIKDLATPSGTPMNRQGAHFAPELHPYYGGPIPDTKSDCWSFGCIFAEVLAFAFGGKGAVQEFRGYRCEDRNDWFYKVLDRRKVDNSAEALSWAPKQFVLKPKVLSWIQGVEKVPDIDGWKVKEYVELIRKMLMPNFDKRYSSAEIYNFLDQMQRPRHEPKPPSPSTAQGHWTLQLPKGKEVQDWSLSRNGESVAFLYEKEVVRFNLKEDRGDRRIVESHGLDLSHLKRLEVQAAGPFCLVRGFNERAKTYESWFSDSDNAEATNYLPSDHSAEPSIIELSCRGILAAVHLTSREIRLLDARSNFALLKSSHFRKYDLHVFKIAFNATGRHLYVWLRAGSKEDRLCIYDVYDGADRKKPCKPSSTFKMKSDHTPGGTATLLPCFDTPCCVTQMENGATFVPQIIEGRPESLAEPQQIELSKQLVDFVVNDFALISLRKSSLWRRWRDNSGDGMTIQERSLSWGGGMWTLGSTLTTWMDRDGSERQTRMKDPRLAIQDCQGRQALILCNRNGEVERLLRSQS